MCIAPRCGRAARRMSCVSFPFLFSRPILSVYYERTGPGRCWGNGWASTEGDRGGLDHPWDARGRGGSEVWRDCILPAGVRAAGAFRPAYAGGDGMTSVLHGVTGERGVEGYASRRRPRAYLRAAPYGSRSRERHFLFLRGPFGPFFRQVADQLG